MVNQYSLAKKNKTQKTQKTINQEKDIEIMLMLKQV